METVCEWDSRLSSSSLRAKVVRSRTTKESESAAVTAGRGVDNFITATVGAVNSVAQSDSTIMWYQQFMPCLGSCCVLPSALANVESITLIIYTGTWYSEWLNESDTPTEWLTLWYNKCVMSIALALIDCMIHWLCIDMNDLTAIYMINPSLSYWVRFTVSGCATTRIYLFKLLC